MTAVFLIAALVAVLYFLFCLFRKNARFSAFEKRIPENVARIASIMGQVDLARAEKLMIVAHPDDETIWGGAHLAQDAGQYLVVCVTAGTDPVRDAELANAMAACNAQYVKLGFPDLDENNRQDRWKTAGPDIYASLALIIKAKAWVSVATHNPRGEYGHRHHRMISEFVTAIFRREKPAMPLFYFGVYYKLRYSKKLLSHVPLSGEQLRFKLERMISQYPSQMGPRKSYEHMFGYEDWVAANQWNGLVIMLRSRNIIP